MRVPCATWPQGRAELCRKLRLMKSVRRRHTFDGTLISGASLVTFAPEDLLANRLTATSAAKGTFTGLPAGSLLANRQKAHYNCGHPVPQRRSVPAASLATVLSRSF